MAIELDLGGTSNTIYTGNATNGDVLDVKGLSGSELIVDGVEVTINSVVGANIASELTFTAKNAANLTVDDGLLNLSVLNNITYNIQDSSAITANAGAIGTLSGANNYNIKFSGEEGGAFTFTPPSDFSVLNTIRFDVEEMGAGDTLSLGGKTWDSYNYNSSDEVLTVEYDDTFLTFGTKVIADIPMTQTQYDEFEADPGSFLSGGTFTQVCFAAGTLIATPTGEVVVKDLSIGDMILTASGKQVPVKWIGRQTVSPLASAHNLPVRVRQDALASGAPNQDLVLTAGHALIIDGLAINAGALVNNSTIDYVPQSELSESVTYYHIETENHDVILANGTEAETYVDYITRQAFDNYDEYVGLYGIETRIVEMPQPRISTRRHVPQVVRERLGIEDTTPVSRAA